MSLANIWLERDRALVAVDTLGYVYAPDGSRKLSEITKLMPLPVADCVLAARGSQFAFLQLLALAVQKPGMTSLDILSDYMPALCELAASNLPQDFPAEFATCELYLVGWSDRSGCMACTQFGIDLHGNGVVSTSPMRGPARCAPGFNDVQPIDSEVGMRALAQRQIAWMHEHAPKDVTGGELVLADVKRGSVTIFRLPIFETDSPGGGSRAARWIR